MKIAADRRGRLWLMALGALAGLGLIWTGVWFFAAQRLSNHLLLSRADGATLARLCGDKQIGGFPFSLRLRCAGFAAPLFLDEFGVRSQRLVGGKHMKLSLERDRQRFEAIWFNHDQPLPDRVQAAYRLEQNVWNGMVNVQLVIEHAE